MVERRNNKREEPPAEMLITNFFLIEEGLEPEEDEETPVGENELVYRAVRNTINEIWEKYADKPPEPELLGTEGIKAFLREFMKDEKVKDKDLKHIIRNMNTDENGMIDKFEMSSFVLNLTGFGA